MVLFFIRVSLKGGDGLQVESAKSVLCEEMYLDGEGQILDAVLLVFLLQRVSLRLLHGQLPSVYLTGKHVTGREEGLVC